MATQKQSARLSLVQPAAKAWGYARVSTDAQSQSALSLDEQQRKIRARALEMGWDLAEVFVDVVSGGTPLHKRDEGARLLALARPGDVIVAAKLDRMFRSAADALAVLDQMKRKRIALWLLDLGNVTDGAVSEMVMTIMSAVATFERARISERICDAKAALRQRGLHQGGSRPFGWQFGEASGRGRARELVAVPEEQTAIAEIIAMRRAGATLMAIRDAMRARGHRISHNLVADLCRRGEMA